MELKHEPKAADVFIFKRGQKGVSLFYKGVYTSMDHRIDSKGHLQAHKKGKAEKLRKNCGKLR